MALSDVVMMSSLQTESVTNKLYKLDSTVLISCFIMTDAVDEEDRNILARKAVERIKFTDEEDSWV